MEQESEVVITNFGRQRKNQQWDPPCRIEWFGCDGAKPTFCVTSRRMRSRSLCACRQRPQRELAVLAELFRPRAGAGVTGTMLLAESSSDHLTPGRLPASVAVDVFSRRRGPLQQGEGSTRSMRACLQGRDAGAGQRSNFRRTIAASDARAALMATIEESGTRLGAA